MSCKVRLALLLVPLTLAACSTSPDGAPALGRDFGEAVKYDTVLQTINPDPVYPDSAVQPGTRGDLGPAAVKRVRTDTVKQPQVEAVGSGSSGSGPR